MVNAIEMCSACMRFPIKKLPWATAAAAAAVLACAGVSYLCLSFDYSIQFTSLSDIENRPTDVAGELVLHRFCIKQEKNAIDN
jgi:hypothetical protein